MTDASNYGLRAILLQEEGDGWIPVGFVSKKLKGAEVNHTITEKECLAVIFALQKCRHHLEGGPVLCSGKGTGSSNRTLRGSKKYLKMRSRFW